MTKGRVILFPSLLAPVAPAEVLPQKNIELLRTVRYFVVEELRTARRFLKACDRSIDIDSLTFSVLNEHTPAGEVATMLAPALDGFDIGVISEAGCPAVADPGADLVAAAQRAGVEVVPLIGPSSILLGLMASGFNGQCFTFRGYLPVEGRARTEALRHMEREIRTRNCTQIFIETPYRNRRLLDELCAGLPGNMRLCIGLNITAHDQNIRTLTLAEWKKLNPELGKTPAIFLLYN